MRCRAAADEDAAKAQDVLRDRLTTKRDRVEQQLAAAADRVRVLEDQSEGRRNEELLGSAGDVLGGVASGKSLGKVLGGLFGKLGSTAGRRSRSKQTDTRLDAARAKVVDDRAATRRARRRNSVPTSTELAAEWAAKAAAIEPVDIEPTKTNVRVVDLRLVWLPTA